MMRFEKILIVSLVCMAAIAASPACKAGATGGPNDFMSLRTASEGSGWLAYHDAKLGFTIAYPRGWKVDEHYVYAGFGPDHPIEGVAFLIPNALAAGTNLSTSLTGVSVESVSGPGDCDARRFMPDATGVQTIIKDKHIWSVAHGSDAGMGNFYDFTVHALVGSNPCLAERDTIHSTNIGNYDPGTVKPFDGKKLLAIFSKIRRSLVLDRKL